MPEAFNRCPLCGLTTSNEDFFPPGTLWATDLPPIHFWWFSEESIMLRVDPA